MVAGRVLFQMFRDYAARGVTALPPVIEQPGLWPEMVADLLPALTLPDADALVGTHPWAAGLLAEVARRDGFGGVVIGVNTDFYPFPASTHPRIDYYTGVFPKPVLPPALRARLRPLGIPVRPGFAGPAPAPATAGPAPATGLALAPADREVLLVTVGARAFIPLAGIIEFAGELQRVLPAARVVVCTGRAADGAAAGVQRHGVDVWRGLADLSGLMRQARLVISRPSGLTVAEALAAGAVPVLIPSDVPWEADAARHLAHAGLAVPLRAARPLDAAAVAALWLDADRIAALAEAGARLELSASASRSGTLSSPAAPARRRHYPRPRRNSAPPTCSAWRPPSGPTRCRGPPRSSARPCSTGTPAEHQPAPSRQRRRPRPGRPCRSGSSGRTVRCRTQPAQIPVP